MHLHIITSGEINNLKDSKLASDRLRLDYICKAAKKIGYHITGGLNIPNADIYFISAITKEINLNVINNLIKKNKNKTDNILTDYVDDWLSSSNTINSQIYKKLISIGSIFTVPIEGLAYNLKKKTKKIYIIPDAIDNIPNMEPRSLNNTPRNVLWHGHASNIFSLIRVLGKDLVDYNFNLHLVTSHSSIKILKETKFNKTPKCSLILHNWGLKKIQEIAKKCDFAILPINKKWASENRLITTFRLGLPIIAETNSSYERFSEFYSDFQKDQIDEMFNFPEQSYKLVMNAQKKISKDYNSKKLLNLWRKCLIDL